MNLLWKEITRVKSEGRISAGGYRKSVIVENSFWECFLQNKNNNKYSNSSDWWTGMIFEFGATSLQPMSIGPGIKTVENQGSEKHCITPVVCQGYKRVPQNATSALAAHFWRTSSHFFLFPWGWIMFYLLWKEIWWKERHGLAYTFSTSMKLMS